MAGVLGGSLFLSSSPSRPLFSDQLTAADSPMALYKRHIFSYNLTCCQMALFTFLLFPKFCSLNYALLSNGSVDVKSLVYRTKIRCCPNLPLYWCSTSENGCIRNILLRLHCLPKGTALRTLSGLWPFLFAVFLPFLFFLDSTPLLAQSDPPHPPFRANQQIAPASDLFLIESRMVGAQAVYTQTLYTVEPNPSAPPIYQLDRAVRKDETVSGTVQSAAAVAVASGDFNADGFDDLVFARREADNGITLQIPQLITGTLDWSQGVQVRASRPMSGTNLRLTTGDFDADGQDEFALAYRNVDGKIRIELYDTDGSLMPQARASVEIASDDGAGDVAKFDLAAGNVAEATNREMGTTRADELLLARFVGEQIRVEVYGIDGIGSRQIRTLGSTAIAIAGKADGFGAQVAIATGDFDYAPDRIDDEIAVGIYFYISEGVQRSDLHAAEADTYLYLLQMGEQTENVTNSFAITSTQAAVGLYGNGAYPNPLDLITGDLNGDGRDEIVLAEGFGVGIYQADDTLALTKLDSSSIELATSNRETAYQQSSDFLGMADVDADFAEELLVAAGARRLDIYKAEIGADSAIGGLTLTARATEGPRSGSNRRFALALGDFNGDGLRLGKPVYRQANDVVQPLLVLNAPPSHFDILNNSGGNGGGIAPDGPPYQREMVRDINNCYKMGSRRLGCPFAAHYVESTTQVAGMRTELKADWAVSTETAANVRDLFESSLAAIVGENFARLGGPAMMVEARHAITARDQDQIYATVVDYDLWEYPIFGRSASGSDGGSPAGRVLVVAPRRVEARWFGSKSFSGLGLVAGHEAGNLLSYAENIASNPDADRVFNATLYELPDGTSAEEAIRWDLTSADFADAQVSLHSDVGLQVDGAGGFNGKVVGTYKGADLVTHRSSIQDSFQVAVGLGEIDLGIGNVHYKAEPYAYWSKVGLLVVDYAIHLERAFPGQVATWWDEIYGQLPDPAFKLNWRYDPEKAHFGEEPNPNDEQLRLLNWEIVSVPRTPSAGEQVQLRVPIHNYSLVSLANVAVDFYLGNPLAGGTRIGQTATGRIPRLGQVVTTVDWTVPEDVGRFARIYVVIDPDSLVAEIHQNNNLSFNAIPLACARCPVPDVSISGFTALTDPITVGDSAILSATIEADERTVNLPVTFYLGDPSDGWIIGSGTVLEVGNGKAASVSIQWDTRGLDAGQWTIYAVVSGQEGEADLSNNRASVLVTLKPKKSVSGGVLIHFPLLYRGMLIHLPLLYHQ